VPTAPNTLEARSLARHETHGCAQNASSAPPCKISQYEISGRWHTLSPGSVFSFVGIPGRCREQRQESFFAWVLRREHAQLSCGGALLSAMFGQRRAQFPVHLESFPGATVTSGWGSPKIFSMARINHGRIALRNQVVCSLTGVFG